MTSLPFAQFDSFTIPLILSVVTGFFTFLIVYIILKKASNRRNTILIIGLSDSGKTQIFSKIIRLDKKVKTYTSLQENIFNGKIESLPKDITIVDFPGTLRLRSRLFSKWLTSECNTIKGIILVIDSALFSKQSRDIAELLYDTLLKTQSSIDIFVACNKQDIPFAKSKNAIKTTLEKDLGLINKSRAASLDTTDGTRRDELLSQTEDNFKWEDLPFLNITFDTTIADIEKDIDETIDIDPLVQWLTNLQ
uniref:Signal recognition particle receptor subunit beta n=1 Tax=Parastrongyloides trichosuri TaxID=131310 RepID=A0A0N4Z7A3_PARTI